MDVELLREWYQDACPLRVRLERLPVVAALVALFRPWSLLQWEAGQEHKECGEEEWPKDGGVKGTIGAAVDVTVGRWGNSNHEYC